MIAIPHFISPIEILLQIIINKYLSESYCLVVISETPLSVKLPMSFTYLDPKKEHFSVETLLKLSEEGCSDYIIRMEDPRQFMNALEEIRPMSMVRRSDKKLVIVPVTDDENSMEPILNLLTMKESSYYAHILLILPTQTERFECLAFNLITHRFVGSDSESKLPIILDRWYSCTNHFENNVYLFPNNLKNLNGKTMKISTFIYKPYVLLDVDTAVAPLGRDGIEIRMIDEFCRWINCTVQIIREDVDLWGEIYENETGIGVIGSVVEGRSDIGIAALYSWYEEWKAMDFSVSVVRSAVICLVPAPRVLECWELPFLPFGKSIWIAVVITFVYASIGLTIAQGCSSNKALLIVFGTIISQSQYIVSDSWRIRSVIGWLLVSSLILVSAYGAGLASTFTVPQYEPSIDTVQDLLNSRMEWGANHEAWTFSLALSSEPVAKKLIKQFKIYSFEELQRRSFLRKMAFSLEELPAGTFAIGEYLSKEAVQDMQLMLEFFYFDHCVAMLHKNSPYTEKLSELIGRLHQSGLLLAWESQVSLKYLDYKIQLETRLSRARSDVGDLKPLNFNHVEGIFLIFITGTILSTLFFALEIFIGKQARKK
ncbi:probable glutamate receptor isoform X2 [Bombyx mandarina]|uniref:Probable glutamate receptor isoform X2 n=1 Tax=Bombyx mandarina TaxID=7092 RepID=A0A6J2KFA3_BOMMA|nr:probable glutamate receptor isoform X2 [Bombyx mandarina]